MNRMRCFTAVLIFLLFVFGAYAEYPEVKIDPFPIMPWIGPALTEEQVGLFRAAGFNVMPIEPTEDQYQKMKKLWDGNFYLVDKNLKDAEHLIDAMLAFHADDPRKIGYLISDEPDATMFPQLRDIFSVMRQKDPNRICFVNLYPSVIGESVLKAPTYDDYIEGYFEYLRPRYASLDYYPLGWFDYEVEGYYDNLEKMRRLSLRHGSRMIGFVQDFSSRYMRVPSESDMAWQVNSLLAYGAKGLWYFSYRHPLALENWEAGTEGRVVKYDTVMNYNTYPREYQEYYRPGYNHGPGILDFDDSPTPLYYSVKKINAEVLKWAPVLSELTSTRVRHVGNSGGEAKPVGTQTILSWAPLKHEFIYEVSAVRVEHDNGFILGFFEDPKKRPYVMVVNKRHGEFMSRSGGQVDARLKFKSSVRAAYSISNRTGLEEPFPIDKNQEAVVTLNGGGAVLLRLDVDLSLDD